MAKNVACLAFGLSNGNGKWVVCVVVGRGHGKADYQGGFCIEGLGLKHDKGVHVTHFYSRLGVAVNPNHVLPGGHPAGSCFLANYQVSAPRCLSTITSPP